MATSTEFKERYKALNPEQKRAVDAIDGPVMVIAGPGTGKTSILTLRIANILQKTDVGADAILALTFTESGVLSMRRKLSGIIGSTAYKVNIFTFHGFCNNVITQYPESFPHIIDAVPATDTDQIRIMEAVIESKDLKKLKPYGDTFYYVRPALRMVSTLKREAVTPVDLAKIVKKQEKDFKAIDDLYYTAGAYKGKMKGKYADEQKHIEKNKELLTLYIGYEEMLRKERLYDYDDMIAEVVTVLSNNEDLRLKLQEQYQYILADEHQDANNSQNKLLESLSSFHDNPNLFIVGDEKQAIFRFQGASLENFLYFKKLYPKALLISLKENYRSNQHILDAAHSVIEQNAVTDKNLRVKLKAASSLVPEKIKLHEFLRASFEMNYIVADIEKKIKQGAEPGAIAVIYRENKDVNQLARVLEKTKVPFVIESDQNILEDDDIAQLLILFRALNAPADNALFARALFLEFFDFTVLDVYKILNYAYKEKINVVDVVDNSTQLQKVKVEKPNGFIGFFAKFSVWAKNAKNKNLIDFFELVVRESLFVRYLLALPSSYDKFNKLENLFAEIRSLVENHKNYRLADFIHHLDILDKYHVSIKSKVEHVSNSAVHLMTAHRSKGLEFEYVYILNVTDGHWGNKRSLEHFKVPMQEQVIEHDPIEDERRLFYVALTRAKKGVAISWSRQQENGKETLPSQFVEELDADLCEKIETSIFERKTAMKPEGAYAPKQIETANQKGREYLREIFLRQGLSVTALNNYLTCPWNYFFTNLLRLPQSQSKFQLYGQAVHETLCEFFEKYRIEEDLNKEQMLALYERNLRQKPVDDYQYKELLEKGIKALGGYFDFYQRTWPRNLYTEFSVAGVPILVQTKEAVVEVPLRGILDKIEIMDGDFVNVVDYKTKEPQSRNWIEGNTKNSEGNFKRQLVFYKLLLDNFDNAKYVMKTGEIDFTEPDANGLYHRELFEITEAEVLELTEVIKKVSQEIIEFAFWGTTCDDKECQFCDLKKVVTGN